MVSANLYSIYISISYGIHYFRRMMYFCISLTTWLWCIVAVEQFCVHVRFFLSFNFWMHSSHFIKIVRFFSSPVNPFFNDIHTDHLWKSKSLSQSEYCFKFARGRFSIYRNTKLDFCITLHAAITPFYTQKINMYVTLTPYAALLINHLNSNWYSNMVLQLATKLYARSWS